MSLHLPFQTSKLTCLWGVKLQSSIPLSNSRVHRPWKSIELCEANMNMVLYSKDTPIPSFA